MPPRPQVRVWGSGIERHWILKSPGKGLHLLKSHKQHSCPALNRGQPLNPVQCCRAEQVVGTFWRWVAQPLLFGLIGTGVNFHTISAHTLPKSLAVVLAGAPHLFTR